MTATFGLMVIAGFIGVCISWIVAMAAMDSSDWIAEAAIATGIVSAAVALVGFLALVIVAVSPSP